MGGHCLGSENEVWIGAMAGAIRNLIVAMAAASGAGPASAQWFVEPSGDSPVPRYSMQVSIEPEKRRIVVDGNVLLPSDWRQGLRFSLRSDMNTPQVTILSPRACAGLASLKKVGADDKQMESVVWEAQPPRACGPKSDIKLGFKYAGGEAATGSGFFSIGTEGSFAAGGISSWYPKFGYTRVTGDLEFETPAGLTVKASGRAAPPELRGGRTVSRFSNTLPVVFDFAAGAFKVIKHAPGPVPISLYLFQHHPSEDEMLRREAANMALLQRVFGTYPFGEFAIVEVPTAPAQSAQFLGLSQQGFFLARSDMLARETVDVAYFAHELGHQWFPYLVTHEGEGSDLMMTEALAHYGAIQAVDQELGSLEAERFRSLLTHDALNLMAAGFDYPLGKLPEERSALPLSNRKGGLVYDMLARTIGRDRFHAALARITRRHRHGSLTWQEFLSEISAGSGQDLGWFYKQWLDRPGVPVLSLDWTQSGKTLSYTISQKGAPYRLKLPVQIELADGGAITRDVWVATASETFKVGLDQRVHAVTLDPRRTVFRASTAEWDEALARSAFTRGRLLWDSNDAPGALAVFRQALRDLPPKDPYGIEFLLRMHIGWIAQEAGNNDEAKWEYERALALPVRSPEFLSQAYWNLAQILEQQKNCAAAASAAKSVLSSEIAGATITGRSRRATAMIERLQGAGNGSRCGGAS